WTAAALNSAVYDCFGTLNIPVSFLSVEFIHDQMEGEISGEAHVRRWQQWLVRIGVFVLPSAFLSGRSQRRGHRGGSDGRPCLDEAASAGVDRRLVGRIGML
ncbi:hypothetical protein KTE91_29120, partial [Burkholderia multivorans]|uniref:hypothetical protein n=1 Tax=Burkholderia multivorans TaxID=87883 RepID=UPI001C2198CA